MRRIDDFWSLVSKGSPESCWPWLGTTQKGGYGTFRGTTAHRYAFREAGGILKRGFVVMHECDNPSCCNPKHLKLGTQKDNIADMHVKGRAGDCRNFGEAHGRCKLDRIQLRQLKYLRQRFNMTQQALADKFGIAQTHVSRILRGENRTNG